MLKVGRRENEKENMTEKTVPARGKKRQRIGELLVEHGLINTGQLKDALKMQAQAGGQLGSILVEMGHITTDDLLIFLSQQLGIPSANLLKKEISPELLHLMPLEQIKAMKVIPIGLDENTVTLAMSNPGDLISIRDIEFSLRKKVIPVVVPSSQMEAAIHSISLHPEDYLKGADIEKDVHKPELEKSPPLSTLLKFLSTSPATDMLLVAGSPPSLKLGGNIWRMSMAPLTAYDCERYARELLSEKDWEDFEHGYDSNLTVTFPEFGRFRINLYRQRTSISITLRPIADILPSPEELGLPDRIKEYALASQGLILIASPAGHGKTTTLAAIVDLINTQRRCNIVTLEDPVEYLHTHKKSNVNQRKIGLDARSLEEGLAHVFRQDPDVIVIDEIKGADNFAVALEAADTGHLVLASVRSGSIASVLEMIIRAFPPHHQRFIRERLANSLLFVMSQRLVPLKDGKARTLACEMLTPDKNIRNLIRAGKTEQIEAGTLTGVGDYTSLEASLTDLLLSGLITFEQGLSSAQNRELYKSLAKA